MHALVSELDKVFVAQPASHAVAHAHELVEDGVQVLRNGLEDSPAGDFRGVTDLPLGVAEKCAQARERTLLTFEVDARGGENLGVLARQFRLAHEPLGNTNIEGSHVRVPERKSLRAKFGLERRAQRPTLQKTPLHAHLARGHAGRTRVESSLRGAKLTIAGVLSEAQVDEVSSALPFAPERVPIGEGGAPAGRRITLVERRLDPAIALGYDVLLRQFGRYPIHLARNFAYVPSLSARSMN